MPTTDHARPAERLARQAFVAALTGLPLWWLLGVAAFVPLGLALCLGWDLATRRRVVLPPHLGWWLLFLLWVVLGVGTLGATAPGSADDPSGGRMVVFGYRLAWYGACTVILVWVSNASVRTLPDRLVHRVVAVVFLIAVTGGILGLLAPDLAVTTLSERLLPAGLRSNGFVSTLVSAEVADVQQVLGAPEPRPKAPFAFTNTWGSMISLSLVFFLALVRSAPRHLRWLAVPVLVVAAVPVVVSLNRGLWLALAAGAVGLLVLLALRRNTAALMGLVAAALVCGVAISSTPLGETVGARLENPHSNERRSQLLVATVDSMTDGSPVVGYGGTRDMQGTFTSIAGGATADCPACGVPPLGTQGQLWLVLFSQGWFGALFFLCFFVLSLRRTWRCLTDNQAVATFVVGIFLLQLTVYDTLGMPMLVVMIALGLVAREASDLRSARTPSTREVVTVALVAGISGAVATVGVADREVELRSSTVTIELEPSATYLAIGGAGLTRDPPTDSSTSRPATIDTEAALLRSQRVLSRAGSRAGMVTDDLRRAVRVSAPPNTMVLDVTVTLPVATDAAETARVLVEEYLSERRALLAEQRAELSARLRTALASTDWRDADGVGARARLQAAVDRVDGTPVTVGRVLRVAGSVDATSRPWVAGTSGLAVGVLFGLVVLRLGSGSREVLINGAVASVARRVRWQDGGAKAGWTPFERRWRRQRAASRRAVGGIDQRFPRSRT